MEKFAKMHAVAWKINDCVARKSTGNAETFARKLNVNEATMYRYLRFLKEAYDAPIKYSTQIGSYVYDDPAFKLDFNKPPKVSRI